MTISISQENPGLFFLFNRLSNEFKMYCFSVVFLHLFGYNGNLLKSDVFSLNTVLFVIT